MAPKIDIYIQYLWDQYLGPLHPLAPIDVAAERNTTPGLVFPSMVTLVTQTINEGTEVKVRQSESNYD